MESRISGRHPESLKRALLVKFYPEIPHNNTIFGKKALFCQILQEAVSDYWTLISFG